MSVATRGMTGIAGLAVALDLSNDVVHMPVMVVNADGRVVRVIPPPPGIGSQPLPWRDLRVGPEGRRR